MPVVYACVCPPAPPPDAPLTNEAIARVAAELAAQRPEVVVAISHGRGMLPQKVSLASEGASELCEAMVAEARRELVPVELARRCERPAVLSTLEETLGGAALLCVAVSTLSLQMHFEFGRAAGRAPTEDARRAVLVCAGSLSSGRDARQARLFDKQYRQAIEEWNVKWAVHLEPGFRRRAEEDAAAQTAVLMGMLSGHRIQARVLSYESPAGAGCLVAGIDVLGRR
jgi:hypothetical protein